VEVFLITLIHSAQICNHALALFEVQLVAVAILDDRRPWDRADKTLSHHACSGQHPEGVPKEIEPFLELRTISQEFGYLATALGRCRGDLDLVLTVDKVIGENVC